MNTGVMQQRIDRLESLVKTLMAQNNQEPPTLNANKPRYDGVSIPDAPVITNDSANLPFRAGTTVIDGGQSIYRAGNDWSDVLQEVRPLIFFLV
jgi:hypothetical protein